MVTIISMQRVIELEQEWNFMHNKFIKLKNLLEGVPKKYFNFKEYILFYMYPMSIVIFFMV